MHDRELSFLEKILFYDLQKHWEVLRDEVELLPESKLKNKLLAYIEDGTSFESVRHLDLMKKAIQELSMHVISLPEEVHVRLKSLQEILDDTVYYLKTGEFK